MRRQQQIESLVLTVLQAIAVLAAGGFVYLLGTTVRDVLRNGLVR
jgi:hypothetical protein